MDSGRNKMTEHMSMYFNEYSLEKQKLVLRWEWGWGEKEREILKSIGYRNWEVSLCRPSTNCKPRKARDVVQRTRAKDTDSCLDPKPENQEHRGQEEIPALSEVRKSEFNHSLPFGSI